MLTGPPPKFHGTAVVVPTALEVRKMVAAVAGRVDVVFPSLVL